MDRPGREKHEDSERHVTYVGFPHGTERSDVKLRQAEAAVSDGARELDVVRRR